VYKTYQQPTNALYFLMYFYYIFTNMFQPAIWPSSGDIFDTKIQL